MKFKDWLISEGEYGTSAAGEVGGFNAVGLNSDDYIGKGQIKSKYQQSDSNADTALAYKRKRRLNDLKTGVLPQRSTAEYDAYQRPKRVMSAAV